MIRFSLRKFPVNSEFIVCNPESAYIYNCSEFASLGVYHLNVICTRSWPMYKLHGPFCSYHYCDFFVNLCYISLQRSLRTLLEYPGDVLLNHCHRSLLSMSFLNPAPSLPDVTTATVTSTASQS